MSQGTMKAVVVKEGKTTAVEERPIPSGLKANEVLFKVTAVAQNPTDWKHVAFGLAQPGNILGCDFVGVAEELGSDVPKEVKGQLRGGFVRGGMNKENAAYAEYIKSAWDVTFQVPSNVSAQQAASAPIPLLTACQAFYLRLRLPFPDADNSAVKGKWILIWSGSTAVGQYAIQLAKLAGLKIATTASPAKHDLVKSLGADVVVDYKDKEVAQKLREATNDSIEYGLDCIAENGSVQLAQQAFGKNGGHLICLLFDLGELPRKDVKTESTLAYTVLGEDQSFGPAFFPSSKEDREYCVKYCQFITKLFEQEKIRPLEVTDLGGIETIQKGLDQLKNGENKTKLVHTIARN